MKAGGPRETVDMADLSCALYRSAQDIPYDDWFAVVDPDDWPMNPDVLHLQERCLSDQAQFWFGIVTDMHGEAQACAAFALFSTDVVQASPHVVKAAIAPVRRLWPNTLNTTVLFCGLPIPDGGNHLRIRPSADRAGVLCKIDATMQELARSSSASILVVKEFTADEAARFSGLEDLGYLRGDIPPMHHFTQSFESFAAYRCALRANYRRQLDASMKKFEVIGATVTHHVNPEEISRHFTDETHQLYIDVWSRNAHRLEKLPAGFFRELPQILRGEVVLTLIEFAGRPVAFAFGVHRRDSFSNLYVGCDYTLNADADLYFNVFYHSMSAAFERGARHMKLGATSDDFKARLGCTCSQASVYARAATPLTNKVFRAFSGSLFPRMSRHAPRHVFKETPAQSS